MWNFWHEKSDESTNTTDIVCMHVNEKPCIQSGFLFMSLVHQVVKQNRVFYQSIWKTVVKTYVELFQQYLKDHPGNKMSYGTIFALKLFYIHHASTKDMIMCCCKIHLHIRWSIRTFIRCMEKQEILLPFTDCFTFFSFLYTDCPRDDSIHISWECTPDNKSLCAHITVKWAELKEMVSLSDVKDAVPFTEFQKHIVYNTQGEIIRNKKKWAYQVTYTCET